MRIGTVCYAVEQGLGYLAKSFYDAGIITDVLVYRHPHSSRPTQTTWYPNSFILNTRNFVGPEVDAFLAPLDAIIFFETPFDWNLPPKCSAKGIKTILMPMYEWYPTRAPCTFDLYLCPSLLDLDYFPDKGHFLPVPVNPAYWEQRTHACRFLHNAGNVGSRNHKGTEEVIRSLPYIQSPIQITIRAQDRHELQSILLRYPHVCQDKRLKIEGPISYNQLWANHDVLIQPEKYNGLSLPLQEARAAGMLVMTSDRYPHNTWLPKAPLVPVKYTRKISVTGGTLPIDECIIDPVDIATTIDTWYGKDISTYSTEGLAWAHANSWDTLRPKYVELFNELTR